MAKKIRFPLEMENGVEVRDLEELKDNFSLARVIGYINDGKLVTWLQDRYENELAEEVEKIDIEAEDTAKKICELFDVEYDEAAEEEVEKAEERKRKLELLKKFPDCMEYAKYVDSVAFDQDDLYDLLDEDVNEIYLCGIDTECCVLKSAFDLFEMGYDVKVLKDYCACTNGIKRHMNALEILRRNIGYNSIV